ncbi:FAD-binding oxidoreductase [Tessaracoccus sp. OS52]|uniref:FAD-binding and (Fe-S)-binding domain-containing protein n=1 Tax=Tessaracoccus sp. OS52 TaxID=2886691 RepID=UPI001D10B8C8|nr:FAD-binding and (Fe-S)-binding domain-containing protein [Tessaracoccus sp. OS52]MCC2592424.1 FAD-binding oxidoreductase [Tessaracoccus sp. OS52]
MLVDALTRLRSALGGAASIIDDSTLTRGLYSSDASLYRVPPLAVAAPRTTEELIQLVRAALTAGIPITPRGAGTSCAGNAVGPGLVIDVAKHLNRIHSIDPETRTAVIDPGVVQDALQREARPHGLRLGPDPSTSSRCTVGGMIGNNACGPRALGYGRMSDNVVELEVVTGTGELLVLGRDDVAGLRELVAANLGTIRTQFGQFSRQVSGYSMEHLLPENRFDLPKFFAGTEGTLGIITRATVQLVTDAPERVVVALGYPTMADAGDDISNLLAFKPVACEGLDRRILDVVSRKRGPGAVPDLPVGDGWMFIELVGDDRREVRGRAEALLEAATGRGWLVEDAASAAALWQLRADGAGLAGVSLAKPAFAGWEDAAVPPERLGDYLRDFDALLDEHGLHALPYGHFGDGCVHARIDFPFDEPDGAARFRAFIVAAAELVGAHGGSMSGEHGDGRARSELLPKMYSPEAIELFGAVKHIFDPDNLLNPGVLVDPSPLDADLRMVAVTRSPLNISDPEFVAAVHQCSGVGKCIADNTGAGGVMCPSYQATRDEKDSTRGRSRILQEMVNGDLVSGGWRSPEVHEALDLCLSCKGCARDCPTGIDMAAYKSRVIHETYKGRLRPRNHYALGWLPRWGRLITALRGSGSLINLVGRTPGLGRVLRWGAGVDHRREIPRFANRTAKGQLKALVAAQRPALESASGPSPTPGRKGEVLVWVDSFSDCFESNNFAAVVQVLVRLGYEPRVLNKTACCGLTWISTGQLDGARREIERAASELAPYVAAGTPIVGVEPSCTAVWRGDAVELLPDNADVRALHGNVLTLAEFLAKDPDFKAPDLSGHTIVAQPHCHHASVIGWEADAALLRATGADVRRVGGCCGLAGNFGVEIGHHEVSVKVFEHDLLPAVEEAGDDAIVLADGFSCQTQLRTLAGRDSMSLAELLATH